MGGSLCAGKLLTTAQIGSFVGDELGIVDRIFTRIGASR
jgi:DNA mismatch repair ATPase MutS